MTIGVQITIKTVITGLTQIENGYHKYEDFQKNYYKMESIDCSIKTDF